MQGYVLNIDGKTCRDLDECTAMRHNCPHTCINVPGSFTCGCSEGYRQQGQGECVDIDECLEQPGLCQPIGTCHNIPGKNAYVYILFYLFFHTFWSKCFTYIVFYLYILRSHAYPSLATWNVKISDSKYNDFINFNNRFSCVFLIPPI